MRGALLWKWIQLSVLSGLLAGLSSTAFLYLLDLATRIRQEHLWLLAGLPIAGLIIGLVYHRYGSEVSRGNNLIIDEIHDPKKVIPVRMAPLILGGTLLTHLFGGSAGREGTAVQMGASLSDTLGKFFRVSSSERRILLMTGAGAGFASAVGAPFAGVIFGMEVIAVRGLKLVAVFQSVIACAVAYSLSRLLKAPHSLYPRFDIASPSLQAVGSLLVAAVLFGLAARIFVWLAHGVEKSLSGISRPALRPAIGAVAVLGLYGILGTARYAGLGIDVIQQALIEPLPLVDPVYKAFATALTVGSGFKGGEFIPLVFIGATLGSALGLLLPASFQLMAALGFASVFGAASKTPLACSIMACELFGWRIAPYAFPVCFIAYVCSGKPGIYPAQR